MPSIKRLCNKVILKTARKSTGIKKQPNTTEVVKPKENKQVFQLL